MPESQPAGIPSGPNSGKNTPYEVVQNRKKRIQRIVAFVVVAALVGGGVYALRKYVFKSKEETRGELMTQEVIRSSVQSVVSGTGGAKAKNAATVAPDAGHRVLELFVKEGDLVEKGQLLYNLDDTAPRESVVNAQESIRKAENSVNDYNKELRKLYENVANLSITAPHDGKMIEVNTQIKPGYDAKVGDPVATIVNDTKLRLHLYYSYIYEGLISEGQSARITLPSAMSVVEGSVEQVNYVRRIVPEGGVTFEVVFLIENPGTLTEGMTASAELTSADGTPIYPYESAKLEYYETTKVQVKVAGPVLEAHLMNYADLDKGQLLVLLGDTDHNADIAIKQNSLLQAEKDVKKAQDNLVEAEKKLENYHASAPISGQVLTCGLTLGEEVPSGGSIYIADTSVMMVSINIDERNIGYVKAGMLVDLKDQMDNYYTGVVESVALTAKAENGVASFPATVVVDNPDGKLMTGSYLDYTFVASQSMDCLVVPVQAVKNVSLGEGQQVYEEDGFDPQGNLSDEFVTDLLDGDQPQPEPEEGVAEEGVIEVEDGSLEDAVTAVEIVPDSAVGPTAFRKSGAATVCFVQGKADERGIEPQEAWEVPQGFFPVVVETGLSDATNVEIKSGLREGDVVFTGYQTASASSWDY